MHFLKLVDLLHKKNTYWVKINLAIRSYIIRGIFRGVMSPQDPVHIFRYQRTCVKMHWSCRSNFLLPICNIYNGMWSSPLHVVSLVSYKMYVSKIWFTSTQIHMFMQGFFTHWHASTSHSCIFKHEFSSRSLHEHRLPHQSVSLCPSQNHHVWHQCLSKMPYFESHMSRACSAVGLAFDRASILDHFSAVKHLPRVDWKWGWLLHSWCDIMWPTFHHTSDAQSVEIAENFPYWFTMEKLGTAFKNAIEDANILSFWCKKTGFTLSM